jgi:broad specificity phosphatase PhoE
MRTDTPVRVTLVRHGRAAAGWGTDPDPGLDELGRRQADAVATNLALGPPTDIVTSPLRRCRETARPLADRWGHALRVASQVAEIPSPEGVPMAERVEWLRVAMAGTWTDLGDRYVAYRDSVAAFVAGFDHDTVVFSHFIAINAVIGAATGDDRLVIASLDNCSQTVVEIDPNRRLRLISTGQQADTLIR